jgi:gamma-glutamyltranspeptidase/glutathione hydrolase
MSDIKIHSSSLMKQLLVASILFSMGLHSLAFATPEKVVSLDPLARFHPVIAERGVTVSQEAIASQVGADILAAGGNAVDAAVATGFALAVTLPRAGNIGGGGFMLVHLSDKNKTIAIDYREMAPAAASRNMFLDREGNMDRFKARHSVHSSGVPGTVAGMIYALENYGTMSLKEVMQPAIKLASNGFKVSRGLASSLVRYQDYLTKDASSSRYFYKGDGEFYQAGDLLVQKDLAASLKRISKNGRDGFYKGKTADLLIAQMRRNGGIINHQDLLNYKVVERQPVCGEYRDSRVCAMPPPSSGGVHLVQMLNILEGWNLHSLGHNSAAYLHRLIESMRRAYADRSLHLGDPDFYPVPADQLMDKKYAAVLREKIDLGRSSRSVDIKPSPSNDINESTETTHYATWDRWGNVVSNTYTINFSYGSGISVAGAGFLLNNEMDDFSSKPGSANGYGLIGGEANAIEPGKRPLSSMTPTIVFDPQGDAIMATGSPGGSTIITVVLQMLLNVLDFDMGIAEATAAPRIHHQWLPDTVRYERGISVDTLNLLTDMGHILGDQPVRLGSTQSITSDKNKIKYAASDPRREGSAPIAEE